MRIITLISLILFCSCATSFKLVYPNGEPEVYNRKTGQICPKVSEWTRDDYVQEIYGAPCDVYIIKKH